MTRKSIYVAFSNQKGGVGKSAFTTLAASYLHYADNKNVAVLDCDYPQHSIYAMRERDKGMVTSSDMYKEMMVSQYNSINKKAYPILCVKSEDAIAVADKVVSESPEPIDVVFFDLTGTVNSAGILKSTVSMDYIFCPISTDRLVMKSSLIYASTLTDFVKENPAAPLKSIYLFWNQLVKSESRELYDAYSTIINRLNLMRR